MSFLEKIQKGLNPAPPRILLYGGEGEGKSTLGAQTPNPIFVQVEDGLGQIDCERFPLAKSIDEVFAALQELRTLAHDYQTVVVDSVDAAERLIFDDVCRTFGVTCIEKADGGYQRGYTHALGYWRRILDALDALRIEKGMAVVLIGHSKVERFEDPMAMAYDRYSPRLHKAASGLLTEWSDAVLFATKRFRTEKQEQGFGKERTIAKEVGINGGERILRCIGSPACVAKNRFGLPAELPLSWPALMAGLVRSSETPATPETSGVQK